MKSYQFTRDVTGAISSVLPVPDIMLETRQSEDVFIPTERSEYLAEIVIVPPLGANEKNENITYVTYYPYKDIPDIHKLKIGIGHRFFMVLKGGSRLYYFDCNSLGYLPPDIGYLYKTFLYDVSLHADNLSSIPFYNIQRDISGGYVPNYHEMPLSDSGGGAFRVQENAWPYNIPYWPREYGIATLGYSNINESGTPPEVWVYVKEKESDIGWKYIALSPKSMILKKGNYIRFQGARAWDNDIAIGISYSLL